MLQEIKKNATFYRPLIEPCAFMSLAFLGGFTRLIRYFPNTCGDGLLLSATLGSLSALGTECIREELYSGKEPELHRQIRIISTLAAIAIITPYCAKPLKEYLKLSPQAAFNFLVAESVTSLIIGMFLEEKPSKIPKERIHKMPTVGDGNCLIHALFGKPDSQGKIRDKKAQEFRQNMAHTILDKYNGTQKLKCFGDHNEIMEETINVNNLALSLKMDTKFLGLEHAHLIALIRECNICVYNEETKEEVFLMCNPQSKEIKHRISYNGFNHWSKYEIRKD